MPQANDFPSIDSTIQVQTLTFDVGSGFYLPPGVTLVGTPTVTITDEACLDPSPSSRLLDGPVVGFAPKPKGSGRPNTAILQQVGNCFPGAFYLLVASCPRSDGDVAEIWNHLPCRLPS